MTCEDRDRSLAARAAGEDLPGEGAEAARDLDQHLASCARCRETLAAFRAATGAIHASAEPADPARRRRLAEAIGAEARAVPRGATFFRRAALAAAAAVVAVPAAWLVRPFLLPDPPPLASRPPSGRPAVPEDWRLAWLDRKGDAAPRDPVPGPVPTAGGEEGEVGSPFGGGGAPPREGAAPGAPPRHGGDAGTGRPQGGPVGGEPDGGGRPGTAWLPFERPAALDIVERQIPHPLCLPHRLPEGMSLAQARIVHPGVVLEFSGGGRLLLLMEEPARGAAGPLPSAPEGWRTAYLRSAGVAVTLLGAGFDDRDWNALFAGDLVDRPDPAAAGR